MPHQHVWPLLASSYQEEHGARSHARAMDELEGRRLYRRTNAEGIQLRRLRDRARPEIR